MGVEFSFLRFPFSLFKRRKRKRDRGLRLWEEEEKVADEEFRFGFVGIKD